MAIVKSVDLTWNKTAINMLEQNARECLFDLASDIATLARQNAPVLTGALRNSIRVEPVDKNTMVVKAGGMVLNGRVINYAWIREQSNNLHPDKAHYMEKAQKAVMTGDYISKYFKKVTK